MKSWAKRISVAFGAIWVVAALATLWIFWKLPSPQELGKTITPSTAKESLATRTHTVTATVTSTSTSTATPAPTDKAPLSEEQKARNERMIENLLDERHPLASFCDNLQRVDPATSLTVDPKMIGRRMEESFEKSDPLLEAMKPTFRFILRQPRFREVMESLREAARTRQEGGLLDKANFYRQVYGAYEEMVANRAQQEELMDRTYRMFILARVVQQRPDLLTSQGTRGLCQNLEARINQSQAGNAEAERREFQQFMESSGVDPRAVGYDPNYKTNLRFVIADKSLTFQGGWIEEILRQ